MKIFVDIDETICYYEGERNYPEALPLKDNIMKVNCLFEKGHEITYWTARGSATGLDWFNLTQSQLSQCGCKYHNLSVGEKPSYDLLICDKTKRIEEI
jgi:dTDP-glucose 4,6-dehydratase